MKKKLIIIFSIILLLVISVIITIFLIPGNQREDVYLKDFKVSSDNKIITLNVGLLNNEVYLKEIKKINDDINDYDKSKYTFYSTNELCSKIGSEDTFDIVVNDDIKQIYFYTGNNEYSLILTRENPQNKWMKINYANLSNIKISLPNKDNITKVTFNTMKQNDNYFEHSNKETIDKVYNIFTNLETKIPSISYNPIGDLEEVLYISFITDEAENGIYVYKKDNKYYAEQGYNGIYEISKESFESLKEYIISITIE